MRRIGKKKYKVTSRFVGIILVIIFSVMIPLQTMAQGNIFPATVGETGNIENTDGTSSGSNDSTGQTGGNAQENAAPSTTTDPDSEPPSLIDDNNKPEGNEGSSSTGTPQPSTPSTDTADVMAPVTISFLDMLDETSARLEIPSGTEQADIPFPSFLTGTNDKGETISIPVESWVCDAEYNKDAIGSSFLFTPKLATGYTLASGLTLPQVEVAVVMGIAPMSILDGITDGDFVNLSTATDAQLTTGAASLNYSYNASTGIITVLAGKTVTITGNNATDGQYNGSYGYRAFYLEHESTLVITGTVSMSQVGTLTSGNRPSIYVYKSGNDNIDATIQLTDGTNCTLSGTSSSGGGWPAIDVSSFVSSSGSKRSLLITSTGSATLTATGFMAPGIGSNSVYNTSQTCGTLTIENTTVISRGQQGGAGIGNSTNTNSGGSITIQNSNVTAFGSVSAAGIGGGNGNNLSSITIENSVVQATADGSGGAGIGGGNNAPGGTITINGGYVTANSGSADHNDIGSGNGAAAVNLKIKSGSVYPVQGKTDPVYTDPTDGTYDTEAYCVYVPKETSIYGITQTLTDAALTVYANGDPLPNNYTANTVTELGNEHNGADMAAYIWLPKYDDDYTGISLTGSGITLPANTTSTGRAFVKDTGHDTTEIPPVNEVFWYEYEFDLAAGNITIIENDDGTLKAEQPGLDPGAFPSLLGIDRSKTIVITQSNYRNTATSNNLLVTSKTDIPVNLHVEGLNVTSAGPSFNFATALDEGSKSNINLMLFKDITLASTAGAAIRVPENGALTISNLNSRGGELSATGGADSAGIGGSSGLTSGDITIVSGKITATGNGGGAGIGGGLVGTDGGGNPTTSGNVTILGGTVTATGNGNGAGIGGGSGQTCGDISITGGSLIAISNGSGAAIGSGQSGMVQGITIDLPSGSLSVTNSADGAAIGSGANGSWGAINILGSAEITATGNSGAGIGGGANSLGAGDKTININVADNTKVTATSTTGAGIGAGAGGSVNGISIQSGFIVATGGGSSMDIGGTNAGAVTTITGGNVWPTRSGPNEADSMISNPIGANGDPAMRVTVRKKGNLGGDVSGGKQVAVRQESYTYIAYTAASPLDGTSLDESAVAYLWLEATDDPDATYYSNITITGVNATARADVVRGVPDPGGNPDFDEDPPENMLYWPPELPIHIDDSVNGKNILIRQKQGTAKTLEILIGGVVKEDVANHYLIRLIEQAPVTSRSITVTVNGTDMTAPVQLMLDQTAFNPTSGNPLGLVDGANVLLSIGSTASLVSSGVNAALNVPSDCELSINGGSGVLTASASGRGAGIGGNSTGSAGKITINNGTVTASGGSSGAGIGGGESGTGGNAITINGGTVTATGGSSTGAGIGGGSGGSGGNIVITNGTVIATGSPSGAGIGGGRGAAGGTITISGGIVTATGGTSSAGIGGGSSGGAGVIAISSGFVTASGNQDIGTGGGNGGSLTITGGSVWPKNDKNMQATDGNGKNVYPVVVPATVDGFAGPGGDSLLDMDVQAVYTGISLGGYNARTVSTAGQEHGSSFQGSDGIAWGAVLWLPEMRLDGSATRQVTVGAKDEGRARVYDTGINYVYWESVPPQYYYDIAEGDIIIEPDDLNSGKLKVRFGSPEEVARNVSFSGTMDPIRIIDTNRRDGGTDSIDHGIFVRNTGATYAVKTMIRNIDIARTTNDPAFIIQTDTDAASAILELQGANSLKAGDSFAGVDVSYDGTNNSAVTITAANATPTLTATGGVGGAGIGGGQGQNGGAISITGGTVTATAGTCGAGIGGGQIVSGTGGDSTSLTISGANTKVAATARYATGIGGGQQSNSSLTIGKPGLITIKDGATVEATGGGFSASIGGSSDTAGKITIGANSSDAVEVTAYAATGQTGGAGIGGSNGQDATAIEIKGGTVIATGSGGGAGIGGGGTANNIPAGGGTQITISGGEVTATGGSALSNGGTGIGGGYNLQYPAQSGAPGLITISGGEVTAMGINASAGIGGYYNNDDTAHKITISGGKVEATGGNAVTTSVAGGAGIGGNTGQSSVPISISGNANVTAYGGGYSAGLGGGGSNNSSTPAGSATTISISTSGTVNAYGGRTSTPAPLHGAGIGGGYNAANASQSGKPGLITISGGTVNAYGMGGSPGIGGVYDSDDTAHKITISGGGVTAQGGSNMDSGHGGGAGIGGSSAQGSVPVILSTSGTVRATGGGFGAGIGGGGSTGSTVPGGLSTLSITGGTIHATGGSNNGTGNGQIGGAGIGSGGNNNGAADPYFGSGGSQVDISGNANVTATGYGAAPGIGGDCGTGSAFTVSGTSTRVTATGGGRYDGGAGIGGARGKVGYDIVTINTGTVTANGGGTGGAGIGGGGNGAAGASTASSIVIKAGTVTAAASTASSGAGIGGGTGSAGYSTVTISGGSVNATGGSTGGAGIGGGGGSAGGNAGASITINNAQITATGGGAGIGGGSATSGNQNGGSGYSAVVIGSTAASTVKATGGGAGIGGGAAAGSGTGGAGGTVTIAQSSTIIVAIGGGAGIGGGQSANGTGGSSGNVAISNGYVTANGGTGCADIGAANGGTSGTATITGGSVWAVNNNVKNAQNTAGTAVFSVVVPKYKDGTAVNLATGRTVTTQYNSGATTYSAITVNTNNQHNATGLTFPDAAHIWLPEGFIEGISGNGVNVSGITPAYSGWADVVTGTPLSGQNEVYWESPSIALYIDYGNIAISNPGGSGTNMMQVVQNDGTNPATTRKLKTGAKLVIMQENDPTTAGNSWNYGISVDGTNLTQRNITLKGGMYISRTGTTGAITLSNGANVQLTIDSLRNESVDPAYTTPAYVETKLLSGSGYAGISVPGGCTLTLNATNGTTDILSVAGGTNGAGIGGSNGNAGTVTINGGKINAQGGNYGAGIGGGTGGTGGTISVTAGNITTQGGVNAAGIGGGGNNAAIGGASGTIVINGTNTVVTATGNGYGAGIGGGGSNTAAGGAVSASGISIATGTVTGTGGTNGAGLGSGSSGSATAGSLGTAAITVNGGVVKGYGNGIGAGIGSGGSNASTGQTTGSIIINNGEVHGIASATGGHGAGIGGGRRNSHTVDINGGTVYGTAGGYGAGIGGGAYAAGGTITVDSSTVTATAATGAGIGGGGSDSTTAAGAGGSITITSNTVDSTSANGAGIGGGYNTSSGAGGAGGSITIPGATVRTKTNGQKSAGIGGGGSNTGTGGTGGAVTISTGGYVTASGGSNLAARDIGYGMGSTNGTPGTTKITGGSVYAETVDNATSNGTTPVYKVVVPAKKDAGTASALTPGFVIAINGNTTNYPVKTVTAGGEHGSSFKDSAWIWLPAGLYAKVNVGAVTNGWAEVVTGTPGVKENRVTWQDYDFKLDYGNIVITESGSQFLVTQTTTGGTVTRLYDKDEVILITQLDKNTAVPYGVTVNNAGDSSDPVLVKLKDVNVGGSIVSNNPAFALTSGSNVALTVEGSATLQSGANRAGIEVPTGNEITIAGGTISATGGTNSAGIGGGRSSANAGTINITSGTITAQGTTGAAGIGGGSGGNSGTVSISDSGTVNATGNGGGAGIGGGNGGNGESISIGGSGNVTANGTNGGAGIGGGSTGSSDSVTIDSTGKITANGANGGAGIGGGAGAGSNSITIKNGTVEANGSPNSAGIGGGSAGSSTTVTINGGTVTANGNGGGAGIGGGGAATAGNGGDVTITGGTVTATGGDNGGAGIGGAGGSTSGGSGGDIVISGSQTTVTATGNGGGTGIGGGTATPPANAGGSGTVTIDGATVNATGSGSAQDIGSADPDDATQGVLDVDGGATVNLLANGRTIDDGSSNYFISIGQGRINDTTGSELDGTYSTLKVNNGSYTLEAGYPLPYWKVDIVKSGVDVSLTSNITDPAIGKIAVWAIDKGGDADGNIAGFDPKADDSFAMPAPNNGFEVELTSFEDDEIYTLTYDADGGTPVPAPVEFTYEQRVALADAPTKDGYIFIGWEYLPSGTFYAAGDVVTMPAQDVSVLAHWLSEDDLQSLILYVINEYYTGQPEGVEAGINVNFSKFIKAEILGKEIRDGIDADIYEGSTVINLYESYLRALGNGDYTMFMYFTDMVIPVDFTVDIPEPVTMHTIRATAGTNGSISPDGSVTVPAGNSQTFYFYPDNGYKVSRVVVDNQEVQTNGSYYTFALVEADHTILVEFDKDDGSGNGNNGNGTDTGIGSNTGKGTNGRGGITGDEKLDLMVYIILAVAAANILLLIVRRRRHKEKETI
ncbi:InlB B-repeat-containing protein [Christensenellaceae bacterium OttesenSCG-928-K19]|nr:InlB B-repeat-containing protein [Christensenellaceae bacterium OttesenSCG-928-K19]